MHKIKGRSVTVKMHQDHGDAPSNREREHAGGGGRGGDDSRHTKVFIGRLEQHMSVESWREAFSKRCKHTQRRFWNNFKARRGH
mmetsp:Transcript_154214/g.494461  ORF Transcript_154214/g.494461 Transcript_154214/m.494461 type:complete len:84 (+) Transcript_154214:680-931(+)